MDKILLIEDTLEERKKLESAINDAIKSYGLHEVLELEVLQNTNEDLNFMFPDNSVKDTQALEDRLSTYLNSRKDIKLLVIDHDLSGFKNDKLSEPVISIASHSSSIPLIRYARINRKSVDTLADAIDAGSEFSIKIDTKNPTEAAKKIINAYDGFSKIKNAIEILDDTQRSKGPSSIIANITNAKTQEDNFWMYVSGASLLKELVELNEVMIAQSLNDEQKNKLVIDRLSYIIGYWFYNIILTFPGVILNKIATSSYLHITQQDLEQNQQFFEPAKYNGPFSLTDEYWWKEKLDEILDQEEVDTGFDLLAKNGIHVEKQEGGYYCIMTQQAISFEDSRSLSWLPNGAILSKVDKNLYDQYAPFFGEY
ncbi:hypothetical protein [Sulfuricurvum sp.]|uniref:hypothetical protein n=1 Tax=Sulfuricurvum sp. TaxID=2025608 RepID=UPI0026101C2B|nr:hypothetical protein [Sulfuricurvum sp.]MDD2781965.1 hypothetical protein [Sulfuricurvum sp.]